MVVALELQYIKCRRLSNGQHIKLFVFNFLPFTLYFCCLPSGFRLQPLGEWIKLFYINYMNINVILNRFCHIFQKSKKNHPCLIFWTENYDFEYDDITQNINDYFLWPSNWNSIYKDGIKENKFEWGNNYEFFQIVIRPLSNCSCQKVI